MKFEKDKEPYIVCIDRSDSSDFELVSWHKTLEKAYEFYVNELNGKYPDRKGRNKHIFKMLRTTGKDLD